jgi:alpha-mannosidase
MMIPWGDDFTYSNAKMTYTSIDSLIEYFNDNYDDMTLLYSTPSTYIKALKESQLTWPSKFGDMLPYSNGKNDFWSGFYTSRANDKS